MQKIDEQLEAAKKKLAQLKAKKQRIEAAKREEEKKRSRQEDTRRKILIGSAILAQPNMTDERLKQIVDKFLTRDADRDLFGLPHLENQP